MTTTTFGGKTGLDKPVENVTDRAIESYKHFAKGSLRPYPSYAGEVLYSGGNKDMTEKQFLKLENVAASRNSGNSELCHRIEFGLSMGSASVLAMHPYLEEYFARAPRDGSGFREFRDMFEELGGRRYIAACKIMDNFAKPGNARVGTEVIRKHVDNWYAFLTDENSKKNAQTLRKVVMLSSRLYTSSMAMLEQMALADDPNSWGSKYRPRTPPHPWFHEPDSAKLLRGFITLAMDNAQKKIKVKKGTVRLSDSEPDRSASEARTVLAKRRRGGARPSGGSRAASAGTDGGGRGGKPPSGRAPRGRGKTSDRSHSARAGRRSRAAGTRRRDDSTGRGRGSAARGKTPRRSRAALSDEGSAGRHRASRRRSPSFDGSVRPSGAGARRGSGREGRRRGRAHSPSATPVKQRPGQHQKTRRGSHRPESEDRRSYSKHGGGRADRRKDRRSRSDSLGRKRRRSRLRSASEHS